MRRLPDAPVKELSIDGFHRTLDGDAIVSELEQGRHLVVISSLEEETFLDYGGAPEVQIEESMRLVASAVIPHSC